MEKKCNDIKSWYREHKIKFWDKAICYKWLARRIYTWRSVRKAIDTPSMWRWGNRYFKK